MICDWLCSELLCCVHQLMYVAPLSHFYSVSVPASFILSRAISLFLSSPSVFALPLSAVSPLISPVESPGRHIPSVCGASREASCAGAPQSMHDRCREHSSFWVTEQAGLRMTGMLSVGMVSRNDIAGILDKIGIGDSGYSEDGNSGGWVVMSICQAESMWKPQHVCQPW